MEIDIGLRWAIGRGRAVAFDELLFDLLTAIHEHGSLARASKQTMVSYRRAWDLLQKWEQELGQPLVHMERGRGAWLTPVGQQLVNARQRALDQVRPVLAPLIEQLRGEFDAIAPHTANGALKIYASHTLAQDVLRRLVARHTHIDLDLQNHGSLEALRQLHEGRCDLAGFHVVQGDLRETLAQEYRPWLDPAAQVLIRVTTRQQGLLVARGNPKNIHQLSDLTRTGMRFVNRQRDSGTRILFDALLVLQGIDPRSIRGYDSAEFTHLAVGALVASDTVDAGFGVRAAAARFKLDFIPFAVENYYFALDKDRMHSAEMQGLISILASEEFRREVRDLVGDDPSRSGAVEEVIHALG